MRKIFLKLNITILFMLISYPVSSQSFDYYVFEVSNKRYINEFEYLGLEHEYYSIEKKVNEDTFVQISVFDLNNKESVKVDTFRIKGNKWEIIYKREYYLYFDSKCLIRGKSIVYPINSTDSIKFTLKSFDKLKDKYELHVNIKNLFSSENIESLIFSNEFGVVEKIIDGVHYKRKKIDNGEILKRLKDILAPQSRQFATGG